MIALSEVHASLSLFAESFAGTPVALTTVDDASMCWPWSDQPLSDLVALPMTMDSRSTYRVVLLHQLLRQARSSLNGPTTFDDQMLDLVESHRVVAEIHRDYPGARSDLWRVAQHAVELLPEPNRGRVAAASVPAIVEFLRRHSLTEADSLPDGPQQTAALALFDQVRTPDANGATSVRVASELVRLLRSGAPSEFVQVQDPDAVPDADDGLPSESTTGVSLEAGTPTELVESDGLAGGQLTSDLAEQDVAASQDEASDSAPAGFVLPIDDRLRSLPNQSRTYVYDEWDYHRGEHRPAWCRVIEEQLIGADPNFIADVRARYPRLRAQVRRRMLQLPTQQLVRVHRSLDGDELDLDAAIEAVTDRRAGAPVDDRLQIRKDRAAREVATAFLVDLSASTSSPAIPPDVVASPAVSDPMDDPLSYGPIWDAPRVIEPVRRVVDVAKDAVALMGDALDDLGDLYAVYGFSGTGRDAVEFKIGKDFRDRSSAASWAAIGAMKPLRYTRMGPAVRHAAAKLAAVAVPTKLLIVVSDGYPQDVDYGSDRNDRDYGIHDTARALLDANNAGIETFCITIDPAGHDYLRDMCPDGRYLVIDDVESLPEELAKLYLLTIGA